MMYDLNSFGTDGQVLSTQESLLLAIAERLEALVDIQGRLCEIQQKVLWQIEEDK